MTSESTSREWEVWSTTARVVVTDPATLDDACAIVERHLEAVDLAASRFRDDSEISALRAGRNVVSPLLGRLVRASLDVARRTQGCVDPTVGSALEALGYDRDIQDVRLVESDGAPVAVLTRVPGWRRVTLEGPYLTLPEGMRLDLGATAKAAAADQAAGEVTDLLPTGVLVSLGGDIATSGPGPANGWQVLVQDSADDPATQVSLPAGAALATSSTIRRTWLRGGRTIHHIVDPATGSSARSPWRTVSVAAVSCLQANACATAAIVQGRRGLGWLHREGVAARLVDDRLAVHLLGGWPEDRVVAA
jgi:thiamine biosynthesis lipoprotein